ncbi:hypothetical protein FOA52_015754 [Chlamydomonas sp. UWO 241]|nr:hypothetical protein FOA52_015754 [Chlamydomonas sp. UWO 241]
MRLGSSWGGGGGGGSDAVAGAWGVGARAQPSAVCQQQPHLPPVLQAPLSRYEAHRARLPYCSDGGNTSSYNSVLQQQSLQQLQQHQQHQQQQQQQQQLPTRYEAHRAQLPYCVGAAHSSSSSRPQQLLPHQQHYATYLPYGGGQVQPYSSQPAHGAHMSVVLAGPNVPVQGAWSQHAPGLHLPYRSYAAAAAHPHQHYQYQQHQHQQHQQRQFQQQLPYHHQQLQAQQQMQVQQQQQQRVQVQVQQQQQRVHVQQQVQVHVQQQQVQQQQQQAQVQQKPQKQVHVHVQQQQPQHVKVQVQQQQQQQLQSTHASSMPPPAPAPAAATSHSTAAPATAASSSASAAPLAAAGDDASSDAWWRRLVVFDTNVFLHRAHALWGCLPRLAHVGSGGRVLLPIAVLREIDRLKGNALLGFKAREATSVLETAQAGGGSSSSNSGGHGRSSRSCSRSRNGGDRAGARDQSRARGDGGDGGGGDNANTVPLLRMQREGEVSKASTLHAVSAITSALAASLTSTLGRAEAGRRVRQLEKQLSAAVAGGSAGDDGIVECVEYFAGEMGYDVVMVSDDRLLLLRVQQLAGSWPHGGGRGRLSTLSGAELESALREERPLWAGAADAAGQRGRAGAQRGAGEGQAHQGQGQHQGQKQKGQKQQDQRQKGQAQGQGQKQAQRGGQKQR